MMLASPQLRVVPMTIHEALRDVIGHVTVEAVKGCVRRTARALTDDFGIAHPRIVVAGLKPHAGEGGTIGREEVENSAPAIGALRAEGPDGTGPTPGDSVFHRVARAAYHPAACKSPHTGPHQN